MNNRLQLNLRLDGRQDLLETIKEIASAEGLSVNAWVIRALEAATGLTDSTVSSIGQGVKEPVALDIESMVDTLLDKKLDSLVATKLARIEERLGKLKA
jgi:hypothetical protein